jgi:GTP:adenosylcobinamide-phosphate guanylyltransferase
MINSLVLAGSNKRGRLIVEGINNKALIEIKGKKMIEFTVKALARSRLINKIGIVGPKKELSNISFKKSVISIQEGEGLIDNLRLGFDLFEKAFCLKEKRILVVTSDIPLVTTEAINDFISKSLDKAFDLTYPYARKEIIEAKYPETKRTYFKLKEGWLSGGNMVLVNPLFFKKNKDWFERAYKTRKSPLSLTRFLGSRLAFKLVLRLFLGSLTVEELETTASRLVGKNYKLKAIETLFPEMMIDLDKKEDFNLIKSLIK